MLIPVILCGGAGTRLWPVSREQHPKPFIRLPDGESLLQKTLHRAAGLPQVTEVLTVANRDHYFLARDDYAELGLGVGLDYLLEPLGRNTAPAIAAAAMRIAERHGADALLLVLPADHLIEDLAAFAAAVDEAVRLAGQGRLVTFGIAPLAPETGYGYIESGESLSETASRVTRFVEKPALDLAKEYLASGKYNWNAGMFCFKAGRLLAEMKIHASDVFESVKTALKKSDSAVSPLVLDAEAFAAAPSISIDYALMERATDVVVVKAGFDWSDIGAWPALAALTAPDANGNRFTGAVISVGSNDNFISSQGRVIAAVGVENLLIVDTPDALLIANADDAQKVKEVVACLKQEGHEAAKHHMTVHRPWGTYTVLEEGPGFKLKRIVVKPGASLSLQLHKHRSEHWVVVSGRAAIVNGENEISIGPNQSTYIAAGTPHRLMNPGAEDCVMIEVQVGSYVGEDDIVRLSDNYGRI
jgi:mannose-1-phosphate guanylyltransferase/mannose-6-phosphate isomerase